jgi:hypothetical protein
MNKIKNINIIKNKRIYLSPYNDITQSLLKYIEKSSNILGYIDNFKADKKNGIYSADEIAHEYDYIIINSPNFWPEISKYFPSQKILLQINNTLIEIGEYKKGLTPLKNSCDVLFYPHNQAHTFDMISIIKKLEEYNIKTIVIRSNLNKRFIDEITNITKVDVDIVFTDLIDYKIFICFVDWHELGPILVKFSHKRNKSTIGIVEGITDFTDSDYKQNRDAYGKVQYVFTTGENDSKYLKNKKTFLVGIPKMQDQLKEEIMFPKKDLVVINLSFVALTYNDDSKYWLEEVVSACDNLNLDYIISQHPTDKTDLTSFKNVTNLKIYDAIKRGTLIISRFSTVILESLAFGKPVVYHKPKKETNPLFNENLNSFSISYTQEELKEKIPYEIARKYDVRERSNLFLHKQCNINSEQAPATLAAEHIKMILKRKDNDI